MIVVVLILGVVYAVGLTKKWGMLIPFMGMLLASSMSMPLDWNDRINPTIWLPIQRIRSELFLASGVAGFVMLLFQSSRLRGKKLSLPVWFLVLAGMYAALLRFVHDSPAQGAFSVLFGLATLIPLALTATVVMDEIEDLILLLRSVVLVNIAWIMMVFAQIVVNPKYVTMGNEHRFVGILANPQHSGVLMAFFTVITLWLMLNDTRRYKLIYTGLLGANALLLIWTGSRTGLGMTVIGVSSVLYAKAGKAILFLPVVGLLTYIGLKVVVNVVGVDVGLSRLSSTANTRDYAWWKLLTTGLENPLFGVGTLESEKSENSWLFSFAAFGIGMLGITIMLALATMWESLMLLKKRFGLDSYYRPYADLIVGVMGMYIAGAVFEGYMVSRVNATICFFTIVAGAGAMVKKKANEMCFAGYDSSFSDEYDDEYTDEYYFDYSEEPEST